MQNLTELEKEYVEFIKLYTESHGYPPSIREIANNMFVSKSTAYNHLTVLVDKDVLRFSPRTPRSYVIKKQKPAI